ncbi:catalase family protein [Bryobacter aggregatus]|uniref:catalase family protein n=1 Tax=Bryobacter aggregatus TaxID=360054 RepID=UPI000A7814E3|nr:catalase family protein [Bryobacter aggregatus]
MVPETLVRYSDSIEVRQPDEDELTEKIVASMAAVNRRAFDKYRHAVRDAHAKSHGVLKGELSVYENLAEPLRQGVFRSPRRYPVMIRLSTAPGDLRDDRISSPRGMAVKLLGVEGAKLLAGHESETTQDFLLVNMPVIPFGEVSTYWKMQQILEKHAEDPDLVKRLTGALARGANEALKLLGRPNSTLDGLSPANHHILGETFYSMAAIRYGDYVAKLCAAPLSEGVRALTGQEVDADENPSVLRDLVVDFFRMQSAEYEVRVQLCTDLEQMPVEDASIAWPESLSPYLAVGKITIPAQDAYSPVRRVYGDDRLSFNPWHCIAEHRPLGSIMRVRVKAYETSTRFRHAMNVQPVEEPRDISEMPD